MTYNELQKRKSIRLIQQAKIDLIAQGLKPTQENVAEHLQGQVSLPTIKRNWKEIVSPEVKPDDTLKPIKSTDPHFRRLQRYNTKRG